MLYLAFRFKWTFGAAAVIAMFHDVVIVTGVFAWLDKPIDGIFLAAAMTIIGLSVNDTVVVFDRIRERWYGSKSTRLRRRWPTRPRSRRCRARSTPASARCSSWRRWRSSAATRCGTSLSRCCSAWSIGTYSSVFTATPLLTYFQEKWPLPKAVKEKRKPRNELEDSGAVV